MNPPEWENALRGLRVPPPNPVRRQEARERSLAAFPSAAAQDVQEDGRVRVPGRFPGFLAGLAAGLAVAAGLWIFAPGRDEEVSAPPTRTLEEELRVLAEVERLFPGQLSGIVFGPERESLLLSPEFSLNEQPVVVTLRRNGKWLRILTFNGSRFSTRMNGADFSVEVLVTGDGEVILLGSEFAWSSRHPGEIAGFVVEAHPVERS